MSRYRVGRFCAGVAGALGMVTAAIASLVIGVALVAGISGDRSVLGMVGPAFCAMLAGLVVVAICFACVAMYDLADRACTP